MAKPIGPIVIFRTDKAGEFKGEVTAIFPDFPAYGAGCYTCYSHVGQHGSCQRNWIYSQTRPAMYREYAPLLAELGRQGYEGLQVRRKWPSYREAIKRAKAFAAMEGTANA